MAGYWLHKWLRLFFNSQIALSRGFDKLLPYQFRVDGYRDFTQSVIPKYLTSGNAICYEIGGGRSPFITKELKQRLGITVIGLDIDGKELASAPEGVYDELVIADITKYRGDQNADFVICLAVLEHVMDVEAALRGIRSCLKPGGYAFIFIPSRNALYARINLILPERLKRFVLFSIFPHAQKRQGFPAYYDRCTPYKIKQITQTLSLEIVEGKYYYSSGYFSFLFPLHFLWRLYLLGFYLVAKEQAAETFGIVFKKRPI